MIDFRDIPVSVCIPARNAADTIEMSIRSILNQTHENIKIYVCDNASSDGTEKVIQKIKDSRLHYRYFNEYLDVNYNFVRALECAQDEIICLYHSDDWYYPDIIELQLKYILSDAVSAVFGKMKMRDKNNITEIDAERNKCISYAAYDYIKYMNAALVSGTIFQCPTFMTKKSVIESGVGFNRKMLISDMSFWLEMVKQGIVIDLDAVVMNYRKSDRQLSRKIFEKKRMVVSPQFILLDDELTKLKQKCEWKKISRKAYLRYLYRRYFEVKEICHNTDSSKDLFFYAGIKMFNKLDINEREYLNALYS